MWDIQTGKQIMRLEGHTFLGEYVLFSPDGKTLASGSLTHPIILWDVQTGKQIMRLWGHNGGVDSVSFSPDGKTLASGSWDKTIILWDVQTGKQIMRLQGHIDEVKSVSFSPDGKTLASGSRDGAVKLWDVKTGKELATIFSLDEGRDWLITTPEGYYDGSARGAEWVAWRLGDRLYPAERFEEQFRRPDIVARVLQGERVPATAPILTAAKIPPAVRFILPKHGTTVEADHLEVELVGMDDNEVTEVELFINGRPVAPAIQRNMQRERTLLEPVSEPHKVAWRFKLAVPLPPGEEVVRIGAIGYDNERLKSNLAEVSIFRRLRREEIAEALGDLYVLCVGVGKYKDSRLNLTFADADAKDFADLFRAQQGLGYREVFVTVLTNEEATTSGVRAALFELVEKVRPTDTVILLFAGHGVRDERFNYYFCTHDSEARKISETGLPTRTFEALLRSVQAKEIFAFIDTCYSSEVLGEMRVGAERLAERLMKKAGVVVFCAGAGEEASIEKDEWGHSAFTLALLEGLKGEADKSPQDGLVTLEELQTFVSTRVIELTGGKQNPKVLVQMGTNPKAMLAKIRQEKR